MIKLKSVANLCAFQLGLAFTLRFDRLSYLFFPTNSKVLTQQIDYPNDK